MNIQKTNSSLNVMWNLFKTDLYLFKGDFLDKLINAFVWSGINIFIMGYVMPKFGLSSDFGAFQAANIVASIGLFEMFGNVAALASDLCGERTISYRLTLPIRPTLMFISMGIFYACCSMSFALCLLPWAKILLWNKLSLSQLSIIPFIVMIVSAGIFFGFLTLWFASMIPSMAQIGKVWIRIIFPLWFLGGFQFSWQALHSVVPIFAYFDLLNPFVYVMEGTRFAILGTTDTLPFWMCVSALWLFIGIIGWHGIFLLKKRLDCF